MPNLQSTSQLFCFTNPTDDPECVAGYEQEQQNDSDQKALSKSSGACMDCKSVKVRCEYVPGMRRCRRCQTKDLPCRPRERKKRKPADTHEQLQEKAHERDLRIQSLLVQYDKLRSEQKIREWLSRASANGWPGVHPVNGHHNMSGINKWNQKGKSPESMVASYFSSGRTSQTQHIPDIVKHIGLYPEDILDLFRIFFDHINPYFSILDEELHTPQHLIWSCPFLFTVICAVASRYYDAQPHMYALAMEFARDAAGEMLISGKQGVDLCQAYLLLAVYPVPKKKWAEDRSWILMGVAIRMALELQLNQPPPPSCSELEALNRTRTWLNCYCVDGSHAVQFGKMPMLRLDDHLARNSRNWYRSSSMNTPFDVHLCAYVQMISIMADWRTAATKFFHSPDEPFNIQAHSIQTQERLSQELSLWVKAYDEEYSFIPLPICFYRGNTTQMITAYLRLAVLIVGFQDSVKNGIAPDSEVLLKAIDAAQTVIQIMIERLYPTGYLRFAMESNFLYVSFAAAFLINLLRPELTGLLEGSQQREIVVTVTRLIAVLGSKEVALDGRHTPAIYSRFLASLLSKYNAKPPESRSIANSSDGSSHSPHSTRSRHSPQSDHYWPDIVDAVPTSRNSNVSNQGFIYQQVGYAADMDLTLSHFIKSVTQDYQPPPISSGQLPDTVERWVNWDAARSHYPPWSHQMQVAHAADVWNRV